LIYTVKSQFSEGLLLADSRSKC